MKILFLGDIFSKTGREVVKRNLNDLKEEYQIDLVIANGENSAHGKGMTRKIYDELMSYGINAFTMGNHFLKNNDITKWLDSVDNIARPLNIDGIVEGKGSVVINTNKGKVRITNLIGRVFIKEFNALNPFVCLDELLDECDEKIHIVDFHAEANGEKKSLAYYVDGKVSAVLGTHTHVQTADNRVLPNGTGYISDVGFCGGYDSVLGIEVKDAIAFSKDYNFKSHTPAEDEGELNAVVLDIDEKSGKCNSIDRIYIAPNKKKS